MKRALGIGLSLAVAFGWLTGADVLAQDSVWINGGANFLADYNTAGNWQGGVIANGAGATADFSQIDLIGDPIVNMPTDRTLGHLIFGDNNLATAGSLLIGDDNVSPGSIPLTNVTLSDAAPTITVNTLTPTTFDDVFFAPTLTSTNGFTKLGGGILTLGGVSDTTLFRGNNIAGTVDIAEGTLRLDAGFGYYDLFNLVEPEAQTVDLFVVRDGATFELSTLGVDNVMVPANSTATIVGGNGSFVNNLTTDADAGNPSTLNILIQDTTPGTSDTFSAHGDWTGFQTVNITGQDATVLDNFRYRPNGGGFNTASFAETVVNLDNARLLVRSNSFGNDSVIAELHSTANTEIEGGSSPGGVARWTIGGNGSDSEHLGSIVPGSGGLDLIKNGAGTLTLGGALSYSPTATGDQAVNEDRRGGVTTINEGTLALTGVASLPAGTDATGTLGLLYSTVDIQAGATLDVSGVTGYSSSALQQTIGNGTIAGDYNHDEGRLAPGDENVGNSATLVRQAGTLTFSDTLSVNGGEILFDLDETPAGTNDLIQVNGATTNLGSGGVVTPNFLGAVPSSGTYTILSSANGFTGSAAGWSVAWPGRGGALPVTQSGNNLVFNAVPATGAAITWTGSVNGNWDVETTSNFNNGGSADQFFTGDEVTFNDSASTTTVNLAQDVQPLSVTVNAAADYTFTGAGRIIGFASLTKSGGGTLTLSQNNTFTGSATIAGGTVDIQTFGGALGSGLLTMSGATLRASNVVTTGMTNSGLEVSAGTSNTIYANGVPGDAATNPLGIPNLSGSGDLRVTTEVTDRLVDIGAVNSAFTGNLTIGPDTGGGAATMGARFSQDANAGIPNGTLTLEAGATLSQRQNGQQTVAIGALSGEAGSFLSGFAGGGDPPIKGWEIGNLGTNTEFAGAVVDGGNLTTITKVGSGTLTLSGANTYTGDTSVEGGVLSINSAYLADTADVFLSGTGVFDLDFVGTDTIDSLFFDGISQVIGTWGAPGSGATNTSSFFTGTGILDVTTFEPPAFIPGDANGDGRVDILDLDILSGNFGTMGGATVATGDFNMDGNVDILDLDILSTNFGTGTSNSAAVPEPATLAGLLILVTSCGACVRRRV